MGTIKDSFLSFFKDKEMKQNIKEILRPVTDIVYNEIYIYVWFICFFNLFLFIIILVNLFLLVRISGKVILYETIHPA
jgi:hypothetical protein|uniref:Uncharacterized protein n=1 Tax=viral metagenome TaxID=1070528 RepID=A0A6C0IUG6_9ZZZZ